MKKVPGIIALILCGLLLGGTFLGLLRGRIQKGDIYPPSSSLRSDPLGTMILYESLATLPGLSVSRDVKNANLLPNGKDTTYLHLGGDVNDWNFLSKEISSTMTQFLLAGGRLVVTLSPEFAKPKDAEKSAAMESGDDSSRQPEKPSPEETAKEQKKTDDYARWGYALEIVSSGGAPAAHSVSNVSNLPLPAVLDWPSDIVLTELDDSWNIIYKREEGAVLAEKKLGPGTLVIATDSYFLSNEAMIRKRHPALLAWLVSRQDHIIFDEAHHGIVESPGIAALARKYRLHGGAAMLAILALLFVWKNSSPLMPRKTASAGDREIVAGRDSMSGFTALLRRNIPASELLETCLAEWKKTTPRRSRISSHTKLLVEAILAKESALPAKDRDPVAAYQKISSTLQHPTSL